MSFGTEHIFHIGQDNCGVVLSAHNKGSLSTPPLHHGEADLRSKANGHTCLTNMTS